MASEQKVALIVGASRGIGRQIAIDLAKNGYAVVVSAKSTSDTNATKPFPPDPNSQQSTISTVEREIKEGGGLATAIPCDTRDLESVQRLVDETVKIYGHIDVLIYNSGAIWWASVEKTAMKRFQLMQRINVEGLYGTIQAALPHFKNNGWKARVIVVSPPIYSRFFRGKTAYAMGKVGMSVLTKGLAMDWERDGKKEMAITSIWPASSIQSAATSQIEKTDQDSIKDLRKASIYADAILAMLRAPVADVNGLLDTDEDFLREHEGVTDFSKYSLVEGASPRRIMPAKFPDLSVAEQADEGRRTDSTKLRASKL
ncbi:putative Hydroxysteroid dehydrogenase-like protein 2 [Amylocarpus encephaloides]|uniref:Hydroxysteroid dehydrogenase-like protein 2 n=1 Tax=Amylocarpus encephaloides TaxID=45428 RepID=A0A9P7YMV4_9HELO|nr:putative Hydroxysteroid dehydrogenase-like protein 2 [Amylocarpus encephaloides]